MNAKLQQLFLGLLCVAAVCQALTTTASFAAGVTGQSTEGTISIALGDGNTLIGGRTNGVLGSSSLGGYDMFVRKLTSSGSVVWTKQFGSSGDDTLGDLKLDFATGKIFAVGTCSGTVPGKTSLGGTDGCVFVFDRSGNDICSAQLGGSGADQLTGIDMDATYFYMVGGTKSSMWSGSESTASLKDATDAVWLKYRISDCGLQAYRRIYQPENAAGFWTSDSSSPLTKVAVIPGTSYVAAVGYTGNINYFGQYGSGGATLMLLSSADGSVQSQNVKVFGEWFLYSSDDQFKNAVLTVDSARNIYVAASKSVGLVVRKFDFSLNTLWEYRDQTTASNFISTGLMADESFGALYLTGSTSLTSFAGSSSAAGVKGFILPLSIATGLPLEAPYMLPVTSVANAGNVRSGVLTVSATSNQAIGSASVIGTTSAFVVTFGLTSPAPSFYPTMAPFATAVPSKVNMGSGTFLTKIVPYPDGGFVIGGTKNENGNRNFLVERHSSDGTVRWTRTFDYAGTNDYLSTLAVDADGRVYAGGKCNADTSPRGCLFIIGAGGGNMCSQTWSNWNYVQFIPTDVFEINAVVPDRGASVVYLYGSSATSVSASSQSEKCVILTIDYHRCEYDTTWFPTVAPNKLLSVTPYKRCVGYEVFAARDGTKKHWALGSGGTPDSGSGLTNIGKVDGLVYSWTPRDGNSVVATRTGSSNWDEFFGGAVDSSNNLYAVGLMNCGDLYGTLTLASLTACDILVAKYNTNGASVTTVWTLAGTNQGNNMDQASDCLLDEAHGMLWVTGFTKSVSFLGQTTNVQVISGTSPQEYTSKAFLFAVDITTGQVITSTIQFFGSGTACSYGQGLALSNGNVYMIGNDQTSCQFGINVPQVGWIQTVSPIYSPTMLPTAKPTYSAIYGQNIGKSVAYFSATVNGVKGHPDGGHVVVGQWGSTFSFTQSTNNWDIFVRKFASDGSQEWNKQITFPNNYDDWAYDVAIDSNGDIYVVGNCGGDLCFYVYSASGTVLCSNIVGGSSADDMNAVLVTSTKVLTFGTTASNPLAGVAKYSSGTNTDSFARLYDKSTSLCQTSNHLQPGAIQSLAGSYCVEAVGTSDGGAWTIGTANGALKSDTSPPASNGGRDILLTKWSSSLSVTSRVMIGTSGDEYGNGLALHSSGNVYVCGWSTYTDVNGYKNWYVVKYDPSTGVQTQLASVGEQNVNDIAMACAIDESNGLLWVAGYTLSNTIYGQTTGNNRQKAMLVAYRISDNSVYSSYVYSNTGTTTASATAVSVENGKLYVAGWCTGAFTDGPNPNQFSIGVKEGFVWVIPNATPSPTRAPTLLRRRRLETEEVNEQA